MISVCIAVYNGQKFLEAQVRSILPQLSAEDEIVVSDDCSTDSSLPILKEMGDARIRIIGNTERLGPIYNAERALRAARGNLIFLSDQDDVWLPGKADTCMDALEDADLVLHDAFILHDGIRLPETLFQRRCARPGLLHNLYRNGYTGCCMAFRRAVLDTVLPFPPALPMHDQWLGLIAEKKYRVQFIDSALIEYREHSANYTATASGSNNGLLTRLRWRVSILLALRKRLR
ncbi:MAG: glycosyltransferase family 2 protein [Fibrobacteraceae bacterium]